MGLLKVASLMAFCLTTCLATYGPDNHHYHDKGHSQKIHIDSPKIHLDNPKIHLDSPKILLSRPNIHVEDSHLIEDEHAYGKTLHGVHSTPSAVSPILINGGYGGYGGAKVINVGGPLLVAPSPIVHHDGPILVRRPVVVAKELSPTQDHLEKLHYDRHGLGNGYYSHGHSHGGHILSAIPVSKGLHEKSVLYEQAPLHSVGHGLISFQAYQAPYLIGQPRALLSGGHGQIHGGGYDQIHGGGYGQIHGGGYGHIHGGHAQLHAGHAQLLGGHSHIHGGHAQIHGGHSKIHGGHAHLSSGKDYHGAGGYKKY